MRLECVAETTEDGRALGHGHRAPEALRQARGLERGLDLDGGRERALDVDRPSTGEMVRLGGHGDA